MSASDDRVQIWINRDDNRFQGAAALRPLLDRLQDSFLSRPSRLRVTGRAERAIDGYLAPPVLKGLDRGKDEVVLSNPDDRLVVDIWQMEHRTAIGIFFPASPAPPTDDLRRLFLDLVTIVAPTYANCHLDRLGSALHAEHYRAHPRTFYASGLYWLSFFGPDEERRQGGSALAENPHALVSRLPQGLLIEVGDGPFDAATPQGEQHLLAATAAMPPLPNEQPAAPPVSEQPAPSPAAPMTVVDGVRGFLDPDDHGFWISRNLAADATLDAKTVAKFQALARKGNPPITQVHVVFSRRETAERNQPALAAAGIRAWYINLATGEPAPVG